MPELVEHEEWRQIAGYEGHYEVSSAGRVRTYKDSSGGARTGVVWLLTPRLVTPKRRGSAGQYLGVTLSKDGKKRHFYIHALVAEAFHGPRPPGHQAAHDNGDGHNNRLENILWKTVAANHEDKRRHGTIPVGERHWNAKLTTEEVLAMRAKGGSPTERAREFGVSEGAARCILDRKTWTHV